MRKLATANIQCVGSTQKATTVNFNGGGQFLTEEKHETPEAYARSINFRVGKFFMGG